MLGRVPRFKLTLTFALMCATAVAYGQTGTQGGEWRTYGGDLGSTRYVAARSDQRGKFQQAAGRLAIQDRCLRHPPGLQPSDDPADDQRRALCDRRIETRRRRHRCRDWRAAVDVPDRRREARRGGPAPAVGARCGVLDGRKRRRAHLHGDVRVSARRARSEDRGCRSARSARTAFSI